MCLKVTSTRRSSRKWAWKLMEADDTGQLWGLFFPQIAEVGKWYAGKREAHGRPRSRKLLASERKYVERGAHVYPDRPSESFCRKCVRYVSRGSSLALVRVSVQPRNHVADGRINSTSQRSAVYTRVKIVEVVKSYRRKP